MGMLDGVERQQFVSDRIPMPVDVVSDTAYVNSITGEAVQLYYFNSGVPTIDAGQAAGTVVVAKLKYSGVLDRMGAMIGNDLETSLVWTTNTVLPIAKIKPCPKFDIEDPTNKTLSQIATDMTANFATGEWCLDHRTGMIYGKKATTGVADTAAYSVQTQTTGGGGGVSSVVKLSDGTTITKVQADGADDISNTAINAARTLAFNQVYDGSTWDRMPGTSADGVLVNLGTNNDVTFSSPSTLTSGQTAVTTAGTAVVLGASLATKSIYIRALDTNTGYISVGDSTVDYSTNPGVVLYAGDSLVVEIANRATVYIDASVNLEGVSYLCQS